MKAIQGDPLKGTLYCSINSRSFMTVFLYRSQSCAFTNSVQWSTFWSNNAIFAATITNSLPPLPSDPFKATSLPSNWFPIHKCFIPYFSLFTLPLHMRIVSISNIHKSREALSCKKWSWKDWSKKEMSYFTLGYYYERERKREKEAGKIQDELALVKLFTCNQFQALHHCKTHLSLKEGKKDSEVLQLNCFYHFTYLLFWSNGSMWIKEIKEDEV